MSTRADGKGTAVLLESRRAAHRLPALAPSDAEVVGRLDFTVLANPLAGSARDTALRAAMAEFETLFADRLPAERAVEIRTDDGHERLFTSIRITYFVRAGEDRMAVGQYFQAICRDHGLL